MLCGTVPFKANNMNDLHKLIKNGKFTFPVKISMEAKSLIERLIITNPSDRISIPEILNHQWLKDGIEDIVQDEWENSISDINCMQAICNVNMENLYFK